MGTKHEIESWTWGKFFENEMMKGEVQKKENNLILRFSSTIGPPKMPHQAQASSLKPQPRLDYLCLFPNPPLDESTQPSNHTTHKILVLRRSARHQTHYHAPKITSQCTYNTPLPHPLPYHVLSQPVTPAPVPAVESSASPSVSVSVSAPDTYPSHHPQGVSVHPPLPPPREGVEVWTRQTHQARRTHLLPHHHQCVDVGTWSDRTRTSQVPVYMRCGVSIDRGTSCRKEDTHGSDDLLCHAVRLPLLQLYVRIHILEITF